MWIIIIFYIKAIYKLIIIMGNLCCNNCICDGFVKIYYKISDCLCCYKERSIYASNVQSGSLICNYPYCFSMPQYNSIFSGDVTKQYIEDRGRIYCSKFCLESHKNMAYMGPVVEQTNYADL